VIIPCSSSPKRGICAPETMYCQRYAASMVVLQGDDLVRVQGAAADLREVVRVRGALRLQDAVDRAHQRDQVVHGRVARVGRELGVLAHPFQLVQDRVLRFLFPVETGTRPCTAGESSLSGSMLACSAPA
jgi:hypothetical protein